MATVAEVTAGFLKNEGIEYTFGIPGGRADLDLLDALSKKDIEFVLTKHETTAAMMAAVYGELTGKPGICISAIAPGVANMMNGIAYAYSDRSPLIHFSDQYAYETTEMVSRQSMNTFDVMRTVTKWCAPLSSRWVHETLHRAFRVALDGRPGPVHLDLVDDVPLSTAPDKKLASTIKHQSFARVYSHEPDGLTKAKERIQKAQAPLVIAGMGVNWDRAFEELRLFAERIGVPVLTGPKVKGAIPEDHPYAAGAYIGGVIEADLVNRSDLLILVGFDCVDALPKPWKYKQPIIHIHRVPNTDEIYHAEMELVGNIGEILSMLTDSLPQQEKWDTEIIIAQRNKVRKAMDVPCDGLAPQRVVEICREATPKDGVLTTDVGSSRLITTQLWTTYHPMGMLTSNGLATMGFGFPAALAAKLLMPERPVICLTGDAGFLMRAQELEVGVDLGTAAVIVVFADRTGSQIKVKQLKRGLAPVGVDFRGPDYVKLADAFGAQGFSVSTEKELEKALEKAYKSDVLSLIEAKINPITYPKQFDAIREV
ncbi:MAG: thiamine pyrophosphate-binding protein [Chloroflexi bacterium]|nr:thiamine pyrophosphate-binding protein [Chloroflexota bacterium]